MGNPNPTQPCPRMRPGSPPPPPPPTLVHIHIPSSMVNPFLLHSYGPIECLHMMSQHSNSLATATAAILVHNEGCAPKWPSFPWQKDACKHSIQDVFCLYEVLSFLLAITDLLQMCNNFMCLCVYWPQYTTCEINYFWRNFVP